MHFFFVQTPQEGFKQREEFPTINFNQNRFSWTLKFFLCERGLITDSFGSSSPLTRTWEGRTGFKRTTFTTMTCSSHSDGRGFVCVLSLLNHICQCAQWLPEGHFCIFIYKLHCRNKKCPSLIKHTAAVKGVNRNKMTKPRYTRTYGTNVNT